MPDGEYGLQCSSFLDCNPTASTGGFSEAINFVARRNSNCALIGWLWTVQLLQPFIDHALKGSHAMNELAQTPPPADRSLLSWRIARAVAGSTCFVVLSLLITDTRGPAVYAAEPIMTLVGHERSVRSVEFVPDGQRIVSCSLDHTARIWDVASGKRLHTLDHHSKQHPEGVVYNLSVSPRGDMVATGARSGQEGLVRLWDIETGDLLATFPSMQREVYHVDFSNDGAMLASGGADGTVRVWDVGSRKLRASFPAHSAPVWVVAFSHDGTQVASASFDGTVKIFNIEAGKLRLNLNAHPKRIEAMAYSPDGALLATGSLDKTLKLWNANSGEHVATIPGHTQEPWCLTFSGDAKRFASAAQDRTIRIWHTESATEIEVLAGHTAGVQSVSFSPDGRKLASSADDRTVRLWDLSQLERLHD